MEQMTNKKRYELTDHIGEVITREARDGPLRKTMKVAKY